MWIIRVALARPYTFFVLAIAILLFGPLAILRTPVDIFPDIRLPVVSVVWTYGGLTPGEISDRITTYYERQTTTVVNDIDHIESQSLPGVAVVKIFFHPNVHIDAAIAQVTALSQTVLKLMPPGITPPLVLSYNASSVPILQLALSSKSLSEQQLFDLSNNFIRPQLAEVEGAAIPSPYGGKNRLVMVDVDPRALQAKNLTPADVTTAILAQNLVLPAGTAKVGLYEYNVRLNASPTALEELNNLPIRTVNGATIYLHDVGHVRDGYAPQTNLVRVDGRRSVLTTIQKTGSVSTLDIIADIKHLLPKIQAGAPPELELRQVGDQSFFVKASVAGVAREAVIAACLTALMILLFLGSWRSTLIITISIPLAILSSITALSALGETINVMTLGGLALAVGILVDDATVTIENINWHLEQGKDVTTAILDGGKQIIIPALFSLLSICIVFVPMFFLEGVPRYLFVPMAEAVVFALVASFVLSRTLVPTLAKYLLKPHSGAHPHASGHLEHVIGSADHDDRRVWVRQLVSFQQGFERRFARVRKVYYDLLRLAIQHRRAFLIGAGSIVAASSLLIPFLGADFFPAVDAGQIKLHVRGPTGMRIEETARLCDRVEALVRDTIPAAELASLVDNIGLPVSGLNITYSNSGVIGPADADVLITLGEGHAPTADYIRRLRERLPGAFPGASFSFLPADIVTQILNFGLPAPVDIQVIGFKRDENRAYVLKILDAVRHVPGVADVRLQQPVNQPEFLVKVDRTRAQELGISERDVANSMLVALSGSGQVAPNYWVNPANHVSYPVVAMTPQYRLDSLPAIENVPVYAAPGRPAQVLGSVASIERRQGEGVVTHYDVQPTFDIYANVQGRDLGGVARDIEKILRRTEGEVPKGSTVVMRGQVETMYRSYTGLLWGIVGAMVLIYLLIVVNFQSWLDPAIVVGALPAALAGIIWMLFASHTTLSVPALTGAIMCMGVGTANSILVISFARERLAAGSDAVTAAVEAGFVRFRPVLMTALAMMIGMAPMALGLGEGGEQNAPLGRAVIGGLALATVATLFFVPVVFSLAHRTKPAAPAGTPPIPT
ncbi:MAG: efflux RND transporter permease subunit [Proteobacteria bacterium]|nr:efflux RND transporter permease subunit [Pseudomonadota bacterium]